MRRNTLFERIHMSKGKNTLKKQQKREEKRRIKKERERKILKTSLISLGVIIAAVATVLISAYIYKNDTSRVENQFEVSEKNGVLTVTGLKEKFSPKNGALVIPTEINGKRVENIGESAFEGRKDILTVSLPSTLTYIGKCSFQGCSSLKSINIAKNVTEIGELAFAGCSSLESVTFDGTALKSIGNTAFFFCKALDGISLPEGLESIGDQAFNGCTSMSALKMPSTLKNIGQFAFKNCTGFNAKKGSLELSESVERIGEFAFYGIEKDSISAPEGSLAEYWLKTH
jgi:hypothetical protein